MAKSYSGTYMSKADKAKQAARKKKSAKARAANAAATKRSAAIPKTARRAKPTRKVLSLPKKPTSRGKSVLEKIKQRQADALKV